MNHDDIYADMCALRDRAAESYGDPTYRRLLEGHSVAVVGPARTSIGRKRGAVIDSHDLVVRFNDAFEQFPIPPVLAGDIGSRAHILYCNQSILKNRIVGRTTSTQLRLMQAFDAAGVRVVACTNNSLNFTSTGEPTAACSAGDSGTMPALAAFLKTHRPGTGVRVVHEASELLNRWLIGNWPRTGLVALVDLLSFPIARLSVSGMTFYHGGGHLLTPAGTELHPLKNRDGTWAQEGSGPGHNSYLELDIMRLLARCFADRMDIDEDLSSLLERS